MNRVFFSCFIFLLCSAFRLSEKQSGKNEEHTDLQAASRLGTCFGPEDVVRGPYARTMNTRRMIRKI